MTTHENWDVVILGSGLAGLAGALAAHELGLRPLILEKAGTLGGGTVHSYGLIWVDRNHLAQAAGYGDTRDEIFAYLRFLGGGSLNDDRFAAFVDRSPEALEFFAGCGVCFIFDAQYLRKYSFANRPVGSAVPAAVARAGSPSELAAKLGIDGERLERTMRRFNGFVQSGANGSLGTLAEPPFYGIELHPAGGASAGLLTDACGRVIHQRGHPIAGLYGLRHCRRRHRAGRRLSGRLIARGGDDLQPSRCAAYDRQPVNSF